MNPGRLRAYTQLLVVVLIWGIAGPVIKFTLGALPWDVLLLYRFLISTLIFLPFIKIGNLKPLKNINIFFLTILYVLFNVTIGLGLLFAGTAKTSLVSMSLLSLFGPILTILGGYFFLKERVTWTEKLGIGITFIGSLLIVIEPVIKFDGIQGELTGNLLVLGSLLSGSIAAVILKKLLRKGVSASLLAHLNFAIGFITMIPVAFHFHSLPEIIGIISKTAPVYHLGVWYLAVFSGTIAYLLFNAAQKTIEVSEQAVFSYLYPILSAILAVWLLKESMTPLSYFGAGITLVGIFIAEVKRRSKKPEGVKKNHNR